MVVPHTSAMRGEQTTETSLTILIWRANMVPSMSGSALAKTPLLRDVPQVKRKLTRRDRDSLSTASSASLSYYDGSAVSGIAAGPSDPKNFVGMKTATPSWLREKPSKTKLAGSTGNPQQRATGAWRRATMICRETGVLIVLGEDRAMLHSISMPDLCASDIRRVDDSLFGRPNVLGIFARPSTFTAGVRNFGQNSSYATVRSATTAALSPPSSYSRNLAASKDEPIYMCFPTSRKMFRIRALLRTFARPEVYGPLNAPKPLATHRQYRQIDMTVTELKILPVRPQTSDRGRRASGMASPLPPSDADDMSTTISSAALLSSPSDKSNFTVAVSRTSLDGGSRSLASVMQNISRHGSVDSGATDSLSSSSLNKQHRDEEAVGTEDVRSVKSGEGESHTSATGKPTALMSNIRSYENVFFTPPSAIDMDRRGSDASSHISHQQVQPSSCFCQVWMQGEIVARSKVGSGTSSIALFDKFSLQDLPALTSIHVEVLQSWRHGRFVQLGTIDLPVQTMRRSETVEGWFPVWAAPRMEEVWSRRDEHAASYTREMVGELKLSLLLLDETVLPAKRYANVDATLNGPGCVSLIRRLCKELDEDRVISHLVDVYTSGGTIVERLADLTRAESSSFAAEAALLFRSNSVLSRAVDKYQRRFCIDWLEACVGPTVRRVCAERIRIEATEGATAVQVVGGAGALSLSGLGSSGGGLSSSMSSPLAGNGGSDDGSIEMLRTLSRDLWNTIYANRHNCPADLRSALASIRHTVNTRFRSAPGPGVQSVGAFIFLRLICPAITSPNLYGLLGCAPDAQSSKTLMYLAKVFLALANKRPAFDKDKEPWLQNMNNFLAQHGAAYDDFITVVSTAADEPYAREPLGDEGDFAFQRVIAQRQAALPTLHREAVPPPGLRMDHALAMSSLVSYVVRSASIEPYGDSSSSAPLTSSRLIATSLASEPALPLAARKESFSGAAPMSSNVAGNTSSEDAELMNDFVDMCCDVEDLVGYHLDRAGYDPVPLPIYAREVAAGVQRTTSIFTANKISSPSSTQLSSGMARASMPLSRSGRDGIEPPPIQQSETVNTGRTRRATVSEGRLESAESSLTSPPYTPKMSYIGQDSFLHAAGLSGRKDTLLQSTDEEECEGSLAALSVGHPSAVRSPYPTTRGSNTVGADGRSRRHIDSLADQRSALPVTPTSSSHRTPQGSKPDPSFGSQSAAYDNLRRMSSNTKQERRRSADNERQQRVMYGTGDATGLLPYTEPGSPTTEIDFPDRTPSVMSGTTNADEAKRKRGWWRRKK